VTVTNQSCGLFPDGRLISNQLMLYHDASRNPSKRLTGDANRHPQSVASCCKASSCSCIDPVHPLARQGDIVLQHSYTPRRAKLDKTENTSGPVACPEHVTGVRLRFLMTEEPVQPVIKERREIGECLYICANYSWLVCTPSPSYNVAPGTAS
jgi:hypothetical protein